MDVHSHILSILCRHHKLKLLQAFIMMSFIIIYTNICVIYYYHFLTTHLYYSPDDATGLVAIGVTALLGLTPALTVLIYKIDSYAIALMGLLGCGLIAPLLFMLGPTHSLFILIFMEGFFAFFAASAFASLLCMQIRLFPSGLRFIALSLSAIVSLSVFGLTTFKITHILWHLTHWSMMAPFIAGMSALITLITLWRMQRSGHIRTV